MKRLFTLLIFICCFQFSNAQFSAGVGLSVITGNDDAFGLQARGMYAFNDDFTAGLGYNYYFENDIANVIDIDLQYHLVNTDGGFTMNPMAGITVSTATEVNTNLHLGLFTVLPISDYHFYLEPKFIISNNDAFVVSAGFRF